MQKLTNYLEVKNITGTQEEIKKPRTCPEANELSRSQEYKWNTRRYEEAKNISRS